jgi:hypothetical protein
MLQEQGNNETIEKAYITEMGRMKMKADEDRK